MTFYLGSSWQQVWTGVLLNRCFVVGCQMPTQMLLFSSSTVKTRLKCSSDEMKSGRSLTNHHPRETRLDLGETNWIYYQLKYIIKVRNSDKTTSLTCHAFSTSKYNSGCVTLSIRIVFIHLNLLQNCFARRSSSAAGAHLQCFPQGWSRMPWVCLAGSHHQRRACSWLGSWAKSYLRKGCSSAGRPWAWKVRIAQ